MDALPLPLLGGNVRVGRVRVGRRVLSPIVGTGVYFRNIYVMYLRSPTLQFENVQIDACVDAPVCKIPSPDSK